MSERNTQGGPVSGRTWINDDGHKNFPGGEVFPGPIEESVEDEIGFTYPGFHSAKEVSGVRLRLERGIVIELQTKRSGLSRIDRVARDAPRRRCIRSVLRFSIIEHGCV